MELPPLSAYESLKALFFNCFMEFKISYIFLIILGLTFLSIYFSFMINLIGRNIWWVFFISIYIMFFFLRDSKLKKKDYEDRMRIKNPDDVRIESYCLFSF